MLGRPSAHEIITTVSCPSLALAGQHPVSILARPGRGYEDSRAPVTGGAGTGLQPTPAPGLDTLMKIVNVVGLLNN